MLKVRSDIYFLMFARAERTLVLLTEEDMYQQWLKEKDSGRVPSGIEFVHVKLPEDLNDRLLAARPRASQEEPPRRA